MMMMMMMYCTVLYVYVYVYMSIRVFCSRLHVVDYISSLRRFSP